MGYVSRKVFYNNNSSIYSVYIFSCLPEEHWNFAAHTVVVWIQG